MTTVTISKYFDSTHNSEWEYMIKRRDINTFSLYTIYRTFIESQMYDNHLVHMDGAGRFVYIFNSIVDNNGMPADVAHEQLSPPVIIRQINIQEIMYGIDRLKQLEQE